MPTAPLHVSTYEARVYWRIFGCIRGLDDGWSNDPLAESRKVQLLLFFFFFFQLQVHLTVSECNGKSCAASCGLMVRELLHRSLCL